MIAGRSAPGADHLPLDATWLDRLVAVTGWTATGGRTLDWQAVESELGTRLPSDYKQLVDTFGNGQFDGMLSPFSPAELIERAAYGTRQQQQSWEPHPHFPAPGGVLVWSDNECELTFHWITEAPDPDRWPVYVTGVGPEAGKVFDCTATEYLFRQLTDPRHPVRLPTTFRVHWFECWGD